MGRNGDLTPTEPVAPWAILAESIRQTQAELEKRLRPLERDMRALSRWRWKIAGALGLLVILSAGSLAVMPWAIDRAVEASLIKYGVLHR